MNKILSFSKTLHKPLTSLDKGDTAKALKIFEIMISFMKDKSPDDFILKVSKIIILLFKSSIELKDEIYLQICKQIK